MKIRLLVSRAGALGAQDCGQEIEVSDAEAIRMIEAGQAEALRDAPEPERAVKRARTEKASK
jgi:hypothetical protein